MTLVLNYSPDRIDTDRLKANQRAVERHIDDDHYVRWFTPGDFVVALGAAHVCVPAAAPQWPAIEFPDAATTLATASWGKPSEWRTGKFMLRLRYTSDVGSAANFRILYRVLAIRTGEVLPGTILTANPAILLLPGPAVADTEMLSSDIYTTTSMDNDDERFSIQIARDGANAADANVNLLHLLSLTVKHVPAVQEST